MTAVLSARGLAKTFGTGDAAVRAVADVSFDVGAGEVAMIMGPSGSGKTTLLTMLGLLLRPDAGETRILGEPASSLPEARLPELRRRSIGFVFQNFQLLPDLTAVENVEVAANLGGLRGAPARAKAGALLRELGLDRRLHAFPRTLSGGEKQRVAIARALVNDPPLLLADEPTANLDGATGRTVIRLLRDLAKTRGVAVVVVSHDERVCPYSDTMWRMEDGRLTALPHEARPPDLTPSV